MKKTTPFLFGATSTEQKFFHSKICKGLLFAFMVLYVQIPLAIGQEECGVPQLSSEIYLKMAQEVPKIMNHRSDLQDGSMVGDVPLYFTVVRKSDGTGNNINETDIAAAINMLNNNFATTGLNFFQLGDVNYWDNDLAFNQPYNFTDHTFAPTAINVWVRTMGGTGTTPADPDDVNPGPDNWIGMKNYNLNLSAFTHEMGHVFGLVHTHRAWGDYITPVTSSQPDYPYGISTWPLFPANPNVAPRELVIREDEEPEISDFPDANCETGGDFCCDTEASCNDGNQSGFPGCSSTGCTYNGSYVDYNGHPITPQVDNFMSYFGSNCRVAFTPCQVDRIRYYYDTYREGQFDNYSDMDLVDFVEYEETATPIKNVRAIWTHPTDPRSWISMSGPDGKIQAILYSGQVMSETKKLGSANTGGPNNQYIYTYEDWTRGVDSDDLTAIQNHILQNQFLPTGYKKIAADASKDGTISAYDMVLLTQLLLGYLEDLPAHPGPWRFVPEFVPLFYTLQFHSNPFNMIINGNPVYNAEYTDPSFQYNLAFSLDSYAGFDGLKIGDVNGTSETEMEMVDNPPSIASEVESILEKGLVYELTFQANDFQSIRSWQTGLFVDREKVEILDVKGGDLKSFDVMTNCGPTTLKDNGFRALWYNPNGIATTLPDGSTLFKLQIKTKQTIARLDEAVYFSNEVLPYRFYGASSQLKPVEVRVSMEKLSNGNVKDILPSSDLALNNKVFCRPNPAENNLEIFFESDFSGDGKLSIIDNYGKILKNISLSINKGVNIIPVRDIAFLPSGIFNVVVSDGTNSRTTKFMKK